MSTNNLENMTSESEPLSATKSAHCTSVLRAMHLCHPTICKMQNAKLTFHWFFLILEDTPDWAGRGAARLEVKRSTLTAKLGSLHTRDLRPLDSGLHLPGKTENNVAKLLKDLKSPKYTQ